MLLKSRVVPFRCHIAGSLLISSVLVLLVDLRASLALNINVGTRSLIVCFGCMTFMTFGSSMIAGRTMLSSLVGVPMVDFPIVLNGRTGNATSNGFTDA
jgi:uncharacterized membrane protein